MCLQRRQKKIILLCIQIHILPIYIENLRFSIYELVIYVGLCKAVYSITINNYAYIYMSMFTGLHWRVHSLGEGEHLCGWRSRYRPRLHPGIVYDTYMIVTVYQLLTRAENFASQDSSPDGFCIGFESLVLC